MQRSDNVRVRTRHSGGLVCSHSQLDPTVSRNGWWLHRPSPLTSRVANSEHGSVHRVRSAPNVSVLLGISLLQAGTSNQSNLA